MFKFKKSEKEVSPKSTKVGLYCMRDKVTGLCGPSFEAYNHADAMRFAQRLRVAAYEDFEMLWIGQFDRDAGVLSAQGEGIVIEWITERYREEMKQSQVEMFERMGAVQDATRRVAE